MKSSLVRKAGSVFLSTAAGFCLVSAEPGLSQVALEPPRPAIRETAPDLPTHVVAEPAAPLPVISARKPPIEPQIVPRTGPLPAARPITPARTAAPGLIITPGPSTNPAFTNQRVTPAAVPAPAVQPVSEPVMFEMPALSVPTASEEASSAPHQSEARLLEAPAQTEPPQLLPQGPSFGASVIGLEGCCPVTLRDGRMQIPGLDEYTSQWQGVVYRFATPQAKQRFDARPEHYAPAHGGMDIIRTADEGEAVPGSLDHAIWFRRQLYLFQNESTLKSFTAHPEQYLAK